MRQNEITLQQAIIRVCSASPSEFTHPMIEKIGSKLLQIFKFNGWGNPFNYNRFFEFVQAGLHGFILTPVGGGSDGVRPNDPKVTAEFKACEFKGLTRAGELRSHSFSYNGTSRFGKWEEQEPYCLNKIMRDEFHHWDSFEYDKCDTTPALSVKIANTELVKVLMPKWKKSWENTGAKDSRIGASVSTNDLKKAGLSYEMTERY